MRMISSRICAASPEGRTTTLQCPLEGQVITHFEYSIFGYIRPQVKFDLVEPELTGTALEFTRQKAAARDAQVIGADFNGDGKLDIGIFNLHTGTQTLPIAFAQGDGTFIMQAIPVPKALLERDLHASRQLLVADFNGDGKADAAFVGDSSWDKIPLGVSVEGSDGDLERVGSMVDARLLPTGQESRFLGWSATGHTRAFTGDVSGDKVSDIFLVGVPYEAVGCFWEKKGSERAVHISAGVQIGKAHPMQCTEAC
jgi:hypothetical protein